LTKLSLNAEKNWHQNKGAKRRVIRREDDMGSPGKRPSRPWLSPLYKRQFGQKDNIRMATLAGSGRVDKGAPRPARRAHACAIPPETAWAKSR
jgi:hypothetical protein